MNDRVKLDPAVKQSSLTELIDSSLHEIINNSKNVSRRLEDMEVFLFGNSDEDQKQGEDTPQPNGWQKQVLKNLDIINTIISQQEHTLDKISKLYQ